jgi:nucleotide sugar dehydrogenase
MSKIAIIGYGFVGKAVEVGFKNLSNEIRIIDPFLGYSDIHTLEDYYPDFTFVCVPTPMGQDGKIDSATIMEVTKQLQNMTCGVVVIKSTVTPDLVKEICKYKRFVYNPEFLTERNALNDFLNPQFHVLGGRPEFTKKVKNLYQYNSNCNPAPFYYMTAVEASLVKYGINTFLAMKVAWFNQWKDLTDSLGARYNVVSNAIGSDTRIGHSHTKVPGSDGKKGYGGSCFPKDTNAIWNFSCDDFGRPSLSILESVIIANNRYRAEYELDEREIEQKIYFKKSS